MPNIESFVKRLPRRVPMLRYDGDNPGLVDWVEDLHPNASVTITTSPVGARIAEEDYPDYQLVPGDVIVCGEGQLYDGAQGEFKVYTGLGASELPPGYVEYPQAELDAWG